MLDEKSRRLFTAIHTVSGGNYKIIEEDELLKVFRAEEGVNASLVREMISRLEGHRFLDVRYAEDGEYCLCSLRAGVRYLEELKDEARDKKRRRGMEMLVVFLSSLAGGFLGALIACLAVAA